MKLGTFINGGYVVENQIAEIRAQSDFATTELDAAKAYLETIQSLEFVGPKHVRFWVAQAAMLDFAYRGLKL